MKGKKTSLSWTWEVSRAFATDELRPLSKLLQLSLSLFIWELGLLGIIIWESFFKKKIK